MSRDVIVFRGFSGLPKHDQNSTPAQFLFKSNLSHHPNFTPNFNPNFILLSQNYSIIFHFPVFIFSFQVWKELIYLDFDPVSITYQISIPRYDIIFIKLPLKKTPAFKSEFFSPKTTSSVGGSIVAMLAERRIDGVGTRAAKIQRIFACPRYALTRSKSAVIGLHESRQSDICPGCWSTDRAIQYANQQPIGRGGLGGLVGGWVGGGD